jgi:hypothetical protein
MKRKSIIQVFSICAALIFVLLTSGCIGPTVRTYSGDKLQKSEVAVIKGWYGFYLLGETEMYIHSIDDSDLKATKVEVLPGWHELVIIHSDAYSGFIWGGGVSSDRVKVAFNFEAGHEYKIKYLYKGLLIEGIKIIDVTTGAIIFSQPWSECVGGI